MKLIFISWLTLCLCFTTTKPNPLIIYTIQGDSVQIIPDGKILVLLISNEACHQCFNELEPILRKCIDTKSGKILCFIQTENDIPSRRFMLHEYQQRFPFLQEFYFDLQKENEMDKTQKMESIFDKFNVKEVPAIILLDEYSFEYIAYSELFDNGVIKKRMVRKILGFMRS